ncbi:DedA family protein [Helicobacter kayseriensis]|uniref:DedA family protein n=1 Tax=Helicobacter kayseriensis TaxID=2905877 RepID=UPI001E45F5AA|nr:DedA family protein [Helicobacter kayseriensis]MCE3047116.1 DedA family protein [Helicobacter kayseriensis]MCE3048487.1 DedA family protein [Helicobacter kayseriensis]
MEEMIQNLEFYGYILLFFSSFGGSFLGIVAAGVLSSLGKFDLFLSIVLASCGNICGSMILVYLAKYQKKLFRNKKYLHKIAIVRVWLKKYGIALILVNKYIYGFKSIIPLVVGMSGYSVKKFMFWNSLSAFIWGSLMGLGGFFASNFAMRVFTELKQYPYVFPLLFVGVLVLLWFVMKKREVAPQAQ